MTSKEEAKTSPVEERRRNALDHLPPPANSNKPLTPFSIEDILSKPSVRRSYTICGTAHLLSSSEKPPPAGLPLSSRALLSQTSPLCALEELASKTFKGLEVSVLQAAEGRDGMTIFGQRQTPKKRRKSRTAFTNHQIYELEKRFLYQKYLSPADRDQIAQQLGLTNAQVITWFQNRRAKLKRDLEEMKADVESARKLSPTVEAVLTISELDETESLGNGEGRSANCLTMSPSSPLTDQHTSKECSEDEEDVEIDVDD
ncbi:transcription factor LBX1 [Gastrophryne carolinensis]